MWMEVSDDVPIPPGEVRQRVPFEEWLEHTRRPSLLEEGYFMAVDNGRVRRDQRTCGSPPMRTCSKRV